MSKVFDMHCDTIGMMHMASIDKKPQQHLSVNNMHIDLVKLQKGNYLAQCFAMFVPFVEDNPFELCMAMIDRFFAEIETNSDFIALATCYDDIMRNEEAGKISAILTIEDACVIQGSLDKLRELFRRGVRMITLTWNYANGIAFPNFEMPVEMPLDPKMPPPNMSIPNVDNGLTHFGFELVEEMNRSGIIIDVSHLADAGFWDVAKHSKAPFVASHSNARACCANVRNLSDDMIRALAEKGGVTGLNYAIDFLRNSDLAQTNHSYLEDMVRHVKHIVNVGGIECIGLGSDFDGIPNNPDLQDASYLPRLAHALNQAGFSEAEIDKIFYQNVLRIFQEVCE